jgi:hypothetical protein
VQLQNAHRRFEEQGIKVAAISYDSAAILKDFADRHKIDFPLLADPDSKVIRSYNVLNAEATGITKGMAHPGYFYLDRDGIIREAFFDPNYVNRFTANNVLAKLFPELAAEVVSTVEAPHLQLTLAQSDRTVIPGSHLSLIAELRLAPDVHVYSPGVVGYRPIQLQLEVSPEIDPAAAVYPQPKNLYLKAIKENVPVFEGRFRIVEDVKVAATRDFIGSLGTEGRTIAVKGELQYQACDARVCYPPAKVPVEWQLLVVPIDRQRSPEAIRHK